MKITPEIEEMLRESRIKYDAFMKEYNTKHKLCPKCKSKIYIATLAGYIFNSEYSEDYKNLNKCTCGECGNVHTYHERVEK